MGDVKCNLPLRDAFTQRRLSGPVEPTGNGLYDGLGLKAAGNLAAYISTSEPECGEDPFCALACLITCLKDVTAHLETTFEKCSTQHQKYETKLKGVEQALAQDPNQFSEDGTRHAKRQKISVICPSASFEHSDLTSFLVPTDGTTSSCVSGRATPSTAASSAPLQDSTPDYELGGASESASRAASCGSVSPQHSSVSREGAVIGSPLCPDAAESQFQPQRTVSSMSDISTNHAQRRENEPLVGASIGSESSNAGGMTDEAADHSNICEGTSNDREEKIPRKKPTTENRENSNSRSTNEPRKEHREENDKSRWMFGQSSGRDSQRRRSDGGRYAREERGGRSNGGGSREGDNISERRRDNVFEGRNQSRGNERDRSRSDRDRDRFDRRYDGRRERDNRQESRSSSWYGSSDGHPPSSNEVGDGGSRRGAEGGSDSRRAYRQADQTSSRGDSSRDQMVRDRDRKKRRRSTSSEKNNGGGAGGNGTSIEILGSESNSTVGNSKGGDQAEVTMKSEAINEKRNYSSAASACGNLSDGAKTSTVISSNANVTSGSSATARATTPTSPPSSISSSTAPVSPITATETSSPHVSTSLVASASRSSSVSASKPTFVTTLPSAVTSLAASSTTAAKTSVDVSPQFRGVPAAVTQPLEESTKSQNVVDEETNLIPRKRERDVGNRRVLLDDEDNSVTPRNSKTKQLSAVSPASPPAASPSSSSSRPLSPPSATTSTRQHRQDTAQPHSAAASPIASPCTPALPSSPSTPAKSLPGSTSSPSPTSLPLTSSLTSLTSDDGRTNGEDKALSATFSNKHKDSSSPHSITPPAATSFALSSGNLGTNSEVSVTSLTSPSLTVTSTGESDALESNSSTFKGGLTSSPKKVSSSSDINVTRKESNVGGNCMETENDLMGSTEGEGKSLVGSEREDKGEEKNSSIVGGGGVEQSSPPHSPPFEASTSSVKSEDASSSTGDSPGIVSAGLSARSGVSNEKDKASVSPTTSSNSGGGGSAGVGLAMEAAVAAQTQSSSSTGSGSAEKKDAAHKMRVEQLNTRRGEIDEASASGDYILALERLKITYAEVIRPLNKAQILKLLRSTNFGVYLSSLGKAKDGELSGYAKSLVTEMKAHLSSSSN
eukprot:GHVN01059852.1.p1 GENE.GHVN01059852.1~~GHVN01059852.1.p1  ORF type:complete len:1124 (+),score=204.52 GHVN01059852.1:1611-4982(+)